MKEHPTPEALNQAFNPTLNYTSFVPCHQDECIDGWVPVPHNESTYPAIGRVRRCACFYKWRQSREP